MAKTNLYDSYINSVEKYFEKLPSLSKGTKSAIVSIIPWLALIFGTLGLASAVVGLGVITIFEPILQVTGIRGSGQSFFFVLLSLISSIILLSSFSGVQRKTEEGWKRIYFSEVISLISDVIAFSLGGILLTLIGFYILYQIRDYYK